MASLEEVISTLEMVVSVENGPGWKDLFFAFNDGKVFGYHEGFVAKEITREVKFCFRNDKILGLEFKIPEFGIISKADAIITRWGKHDVQGDILDGEITNVYLEGKNKWFKIENIELGYPYNGKFPRYFNGSYSHNTRFGLFTFSNECWMNK